MRVNSITSNLEGGDTFALALFSWCGCVVLRSSRSLTAAPTTQRCPTAPLFPMWGYNCGRVVTNQYRSRRRHALRESKRPGCTLTMPAGWSPVVVTVPTGQILPDKSHELVSRSHQRAARAVQYSHFAGNRGPVGRGLGTPGAGVHRRRPLARRVQTIRTPTSDMADRRQTAGRGAVGVGTPSAQGTVCNPSPRKWRRVQQRL